MFGKMFLMVIAMLFAGILHAQNTYYWVGGASGSYATSTNWNTTKGGGGSARTTPNAGDILIFDGNNIGSGTTGSAQTVTLSSQSTETVSQIIIMRNSTFTNSAFATGQNITVTFGSGATVTVTNDIVVDKSCTFNDGGSTFVVGGSLVNAGAHTGTGKIQLTGTSNSTCMTYLLMNGNNSNTGAGYATNNIVFFGTQWTTGATYTANQQIISNGLVYTVTTGGTSGATAPSGYAVSQKPDAGSAVVYAYAGIAASAVVTVSSGAITSLASLTCGSGYIATSTSGISTFCTSVSSSGTFGGQSVTTVATLVAYMGKLANGVISGTVGTATNIELKSNNSNNSSASPYNDHYILSPQTSVTNANTGNGGSTLTVNGTLTLTKGYLYLRACSYASVGAAATLSLSSTTSLISCVAGAGGLSGGTGGNAGNITVNNTTKTTVGNSVGTVCFEQAATNNYSINAITMTAGYLILGTQVICGSNPGLKLNGGTIDDGGYVISLGNGYTGTATTGVGHVSQGLTGGLKINGASKTLGTAGGNLTIGNLLLGNTGTHVLACNTTINGTVFFSNTNLLSTNGFTLTMANGSGVNITNATGNFTTPTGTLKYGASASDLVNVTIGITMTSGIELVPTTLTGKIGLLTVSGSAVYTYNPSSNVTFNTGVTLSGTGTGALTISSGKTVLMAANSTITRSSTGTIVNNGNGFQYGTLSTDRVNVTIGASVTSSYELTGSTGKVGTLTVNGGVTYTLGGNASLDGIVISTSNDKLDASTNSISENTAGGMTVSNLGIIKTSNTGTTPLPTGKAWPGTVQYAGTSGHVVSATSYTNLTLLNASGSLTNDANLSVSGTLTTTAGGTLALGAYNLSTAAVSNGGTISTTSTSATPITASLDYSGASNAGSVQFLGSSAQTIPAATYGAVTLNNTAGVSLGGSITIGGTLSFSNGTTVLAVGANTLTLKGAVNITSGASSGSINASDPSATVVYSGSSAQTINNYTYPNPGGVNNLTIANSAGVTLSMPITVTGTLTLTSGRVTTTATNILIAASTATVSNASTASYVFGPFEWSLPASYSTASTLVFPVGVYTGGTDYYYGLSLVNPVTGGSATTITATSFQANSGGGVDASLASINTSEYWQLAYTGSFTSASSIKLSSATASGIGNNTIGASATKTGTYTSLSATTPAYPVVTSVSGITSTNQFFALGLLPLSSLGITSLVPTSAYSFQNGGLSAAYYGQTISIGGNLLNTVTSLTVNGSASIPAASFVSQTSTLIKVIVPSDAALSGNVSITDGTTTATAAFTVSGFVSNASTDWNTGSTWLGGNVPASGATVAVNNAVTLNASATNNPGTVTVQTGGSLVFGTSGSITITTSLINSGTINQTSGGTLTLSSGASFANSGTFTYGVGTVVFAGTGTITGTTPAFYNLTLNGALTLPATPAINNNLVFNTTTSSLSQVPTYGSSATLVYKAVRTVGAEWANFKTGAINTITVIAPGSGYTSVPTITGNVGTGLTATASLGVATITAVGSGYTSIPTVSITGGGGSGATAVAYIKAGVLSISVTSNGSGYTSVPTVNVTGGGGTFTSATANLGIFGVSVSAGGTGYTSTSCTVTGGGGSGASLVAIPAVGLGIPANVTIDPGSGNTVTGAASSGRSCSGTLNINSGTFLLNAGQIYMGNSSNGGTLVVNTGATLDLATVGIFSTGTLNTSSTNGTIRSGVNSTTAYQYPFPANLTWGGLVQYYAPTANNTRITPGTFNNVDLDFGINNGIVLDNVSNSSATYIFNGNVALNNASSSISTPNFTTVIFNGSGQSIPGNTNFYNLTLGTGTTFPSGTVSIQNTFNTNGVSGATQGTINFTGTHAQTIPAFNYNNLTISGTGRSGSVTLSGTIGVASTLSHTATYTAPAAFVAGTSTVNYNGTGTSSIAALSYNNLIISGTRSGTPTITLPNGTINVAGTFGTSQTGAVTYITTGNTLNLNGSGTSTIASPFTHNILNLTTGTLSLSAATTSNGLATISSGATLQMAGGSISAAPTYVGTASLVYKATATVGNEWGSGNSVGSGVPQVISFDAGSGTITTPSTLRTIIGDVSIVSGTLKLGGTLQVNGNWADNGTFNPNSNTVIFGGSYTSSITTPESFYNLQISNDVTLSSPISVSGVLTLTSGVLTSTSVNLLTIANTSNTAISGGGSGTYVDGPIKWSLPSSFSGAATYTYPVGKNSIYIPFSLINPTTGSGAVYATVEAFDAGSSGSVDGTLSGVNSGYWVLNTTGNYTGVGNVQLTSTSVANSSVVAKSTGGSYTSLGGSTSLPTVTSVNTVGTGSIQYFSVGLIPGVSLGAITATSPAFSGQSALTATPNGYYGQTLTINGNGFTGSTTVTINGAPATVLSHTATTLTAKVPAASTATGNLVVTDGSLSDNTSFTVLGYVSNAATDWNTNSTWLGNVIPTANSNVSVRHAITINAPVTNALSNVSLASGSSIIYGVNGSLTVNTALTNAGTISMAAGGTLNIKGTFTNTGTLNATAGTVVFNGTGTQSIPVPSSNTYYNLSISNGSTNSAPGALTVNGQLTIASGATLDMGTNILSGTMTQELGTGTLLAGANTSAPIPSGVNWAGTVNYTGTGAQTVVAGAYNNLTVSARTGSSVTLINGGTISVSGTFTPGTLTSGSYVVAGNTFSFNGTSAQNIPAFTFTNLTIANSNASTATATGAIVVNTNLQINDGATLDMVSNQLTGSSLTTSNNSGSGTGTLKTQNTTSTPLPTSRTWNFGVTYNNASGAQTVMAGTYNGTLNSAGTSGTNTVSAAITVNGRLLIGAGHTLSISTFGIATASTIDPSGIQGTLLTTSNGSAAYQFPANKTWGGKVAYGAASTSKLVPGVFNNLDLDNGGAVTSTAMNLDGIGGTSSTATFEVKGTLSMSPASAITTANNTTFKFTGTNQILPAAGMTFYNVAFGTGTNLQTGTNLTIQNNFDISNSDIKTINAGMITFSPTATSSTSLYMPNIKYYSLYIGGGTSSTNTIAFASPGEIQVANSFVLNSKYSYNISNNIKLLGTLSPVTNVSATLTSSSTLVTCPTAGLDVGMVVVGSGIQTNTTITKINSGAGTITISSTAQSSGSSTLSFYPTLELYEYSTGTTNAYSGTLTIPNNTFYSATSSFTNANGATVQNSGTWNILGASFSNNMTITGSGTVRLAGSASQGLSGTGTISNLTIDNTLGVSIGSSSMQNITGILKVANGQFNTGTNGLTLKSTSITNSALLDQISGTASVTGTATVERYIPKGFRGYRDIAPEVYGAGTINANWQEGATNVNSNPKPGYGIFITGSNTADATNAGKLDANGFDYAAIAGSNTQDYTYDPLYTNPIPIYGHFKALANTSTNLDPFTGYRLLIRGDRSANLYTSPVTNTQSGLAMFNATTLRATGQLVTGTVIYNTIANGGVTNTATGGNTSVGLNATANGFSLVANPYVAPVSWTSVYTTASGGANTNHLNGSYWYLDPTSAETGKYIAYNAITGSPVTVTGPNGGTYSNTGTVPAGTDYIQPGQAFFVQTATSGTPTLTFTESCKQASSTNLKSIFGNTVSLSKIYISLMRKDSTYIRVDAAAVAFRSDFGNTTYGAQDALKFASAHDNLSISDKGKNLSIDGRLPATASDAISLKITSPTATAYQLSVDASNYVSNGFEPLLYDAFKNTTKALGTGSTTISFTVDASNAASFSNRFTILFAPSALPVNSIVASAALSNKIATINWNTVGEKNVVAYEVEKSADAKNFTAIEKVTAKNTATASYTSTDNSVTATTYYRIKAISTAGSISYSNVAKLTYNVQLTTYNLYPNPLKGKTLNVELANVVAGKYTVSIYNALGQRVSGQTISHTGGSATHAISIDNVLAAGVYSVTISEANSKQVVHQTNLSVQP